VEFDCGEDAVVALLSVPEGDDKPEKYPALFERAQALVINKTDLLPYVPFDMTVAVRHAKRLQADLPVFPLSCTARTGLEAWYGWLQTAVQRKKQAGGAQNVLTPGKGAGASAATDGQTA